MFQALWLLRKSRYYCVNPLNENIFTKADLYGPSSYLKSFIFIGFNPLSPPKAAALKGEAPPGLPLKGAGQDSSDAQPKVNILMNSNIFVFLCFHGLSLYIPIGIGCKWWCPQC